MMTSPTISFGDLTIQGQEFCILKCLTEKAFEAFFYLHPNQNLSDFQYGLTTKIFVDHYMLRDNLVVQPTWHNPEDDEVYQSLANWYVSLLSFGENRSLQYTEVYYTLCYRNRDPREESTTTDPEQPREESSTEEPAPVVHLAPSVLAPPGTVPPAPPESINNVTASPVPAAPDPDKPVVITTVVTTPVPAAPDPDTTTVAIVSTPPVPAAPDPPDTLVATTVVATSAPIKVLPAPASIILFPNATVL